jgi:hypothetical protein
VATLAPIDDVQRAGVRPTAMTRSLVALGVLVTAVSLCGVGAHATYGARVTADEPQYLLTAISIGEDGDLDIADELADEAYRPFHRVDLPRQSYPSAGGEELSPHDPLLPVLLALPVLSGGWVGAKVTLAVFAGLLAALTAWVAIERFGVARRTAWWVVASFGCSAPLATYATQIYPEIPAALAATIALAAVTGRLDRRGQLTLVAAVTALTWLSVKYAPVGASLIAVGLWQLRSRPRGFVTVVLAAAASAIVHAALHLSIYGGFTPYSVGRHFVDGGQLTVIGSSPHYLGRARRITGLLVDDAFGLGAWAPAWLLLPFALGAWLRARPQSSASTVVPLATGWVVATFAALTMHGWWWPGRQLVVVLPFAVVMLAWSVDHVPNLRRVFVPLALIGVATWCVTTAEAIARRRVLIVDFDRTANPWYRLWHQFLPDGRRAGVRDDLVLVAWTVLLLWTAVLAWRSVRHRSPSV